MAQKKILLVEDEKSIREMLRCLLELEGYTVLTANDGKEGLSLLRSTRSLCLILLDMMMPEMNGWDFLATLNRDAAAASIPVIVISALNESAENLRSAAVVQKPIHLQTLLTTVQRHCA